MQIQGLLWPIDVPSGDGRFRGGQNQAALHSKLTEFRFVLRSGFRYFVVAVQLVNEGSERDNEEYTRSWPCSVFCGKPGSNEYAWNNFGWEIE